MDPSTTWQVRQSFGGDDREALDEFHRQAWGGPIVVAHDEAIDLRTLPALVAQGPDGKQYAVPLDIHSIILYYNKDILKKAW